MPNKDEKPAKTVEEAQPEPVFIAPKVGDAVRYIGANEEAHEATITALNGIYPIIYAELAVPINGLSHRIVGVPFEPLGGMNTWALKA